MEFRLVPTGVPGSWGLSSFSTPLIICWKEVPFQNISQKIGRSLSQKPLIPMTMEGLLDHQTRFDH